MNPQELMNGLAEKNRQLTDKNKELSELYHKYAAAEQEYNIAYAQKIAELRIAGTPITVAKDMAKGDRNVAKMFYDMRIAEGVLNACRERIKDLRASIDTYRSLLSWLKEEYSQTRFHDGNT